MATGSGSDNVFNPRRTLAALKPFQNRSSPSTEVSGSKTGLSRTGKSFAAIAALTREVNQAKKPKLKDVKEAMLADAKRDRKMDTLTIIQSKISLFSYEDMVAISKNILINDHSLDSKPGCVNDARMGTVSTITPCENCRKPDCPGHYGLIDFHNTPIYNPCYIRTIVLVLNCVCNNCGRLKITKEQMLDKGLFKLSGNKRLKTIGELVSTNTECFSDKPKLPGGPILHCERNPKFTTKDVKESGVILYAFPNADGKISKDAVYQPADINEVFAILSLISPEDAKLMGFDSYTKPKDMIMRAMLVIPPIARPSVTAGGYIMNDQLTVAYGKIVKKAKLANSNSGNDVAARFELYTAVREMLSKSEGKKVGTKDFLSIFERIQGKEAIFRGYLMGKRNDQCGRTVAGPDPKLKFGQVRNPIYYRDHLTKRIPVTYFNYPDLKRKLDQGDITHVILGLTGYRRSVPRNQSGVVLNQYQDTVNDLYEGDVVERCLENGDRMVMNRQPTLHKGSMMAYKVQLANQLTNGFHLSNCGPMNLDFDGDETNNWNPQDFEVEAECEYIMNARKNIMSSEANKPVAGLTMNAVTACYLLSGLTTQIDNKTFLRLTNLLEEPVDLENFTARCLRYNIHPRSGKALLSLLFPADFYYTAADSSGNTVKIREGILISGLLRKAHTGASSRSIVQDLYKAYGDDRACQFLTEAPFITNQWIMARGFTVGMKDVVNDVIDDDTGNIINANKRILQQKLVETYNEIEALEGSTDKSPLEREFRERQIKNKLDITKNVGSVLALKVLDPTNAILIQCEDGAGTKGASVNIAAITTLVGQQFYRGNRLKPTITNNRRLNVQFDPDSEDPRAHGFIERSYFEGLDTAGLVFIQQSGREGIMDTALKTAETGTMQHNMIKAFENIIIAEDGSVRNTLGALFMPSYNGGFSVENQLNVGGEISFYDLDAIVGTINGQRGYVKKDDLKQIESNIGLLNSLSDGLDPLTFNGEGEKKKPVYKPLISGKDRSRKVIDITTLDRPVTQIRQKLTKYEKARLIGTRATLIGLGSVPKVPISSLDLIDLADAEYHQGLIDVYIIRKYPNGSVEKVKATVDRI